MRDSSDRENPSHGRTSYAAALDFTNCTPVAAAISAAGSSDYTFRADDAVKGGTSIDLSP
jgi:hypothetical protein